MLLIIYAVGSFIGWWNFSWWVFGLVVLIEGFMSRNYNLEEED